MTVRSVDKLLSRSDETAEVASLSCDLVAPTSETFEIPETRKRYFQYFFYKVYFFKNQSRSTGDYISEYFFKYLFL